MKKIYPAIFKRNSSGYEICFPDVDEVVVEAENIAEGLEFASERLGRGLGTLVEKNVTLPTPSPINTLSIDSEKEFATLISVDLNDYLKDTQLDKKTIKIPHWLNVRATKEGINFSKTMTEALAKKLNI
ncbi:HicB family protein [Enterococcus thailandicus]|uniref:type II toxin-antitoxin system HicB family antitoxin n=1 Tax=Enterococcus thailandicus TaxID=417368 RepID=UPI00244D8125|nr:type II toxin-antitoxin system HicB family antitoxin [Enterococcus thailandicus]GMC02522.1 HicB family protein [Enterococcus thailandicus]GMC10048.1 HicB family protein [Enterococcus thailandicus]